MSFGRFFSRRQCSTSKPRCRIAINTDHVDSLFDWIVGDQAGATVGSVLVASFLELLRTVPIPESVGRLKRSGILAGRTRRVLEG